MLSALDSKLLAILAITLGSIIFGFIPSILGLGSRCKNSIVLSSVLCFGGGVLIATSIVHILPDVRNDIPQYSELVFCAGFFVIYLVDVILIVLRCHSSHDNNEEAEHLIRNQIHSSYGSIDGDDSESLDVIIPYQATCKNFGLLAAFSVHSLLEGLVVGVQSTANGVLLLLGAVSCHKLLVAFCLGAELSADGRPAYALIWPLTIFILGSDLGILIGIVIDTGSTSTDSLSIPILQGLAGGTLLYVAVCEIIPREKSRKLPHWAFVIQYIALLSGFGVMSLLSLCV